jgi:putative ABC transport system permease protein
MRAYRALLHLFPASFRIEYGEEMCAILARSRRETAGPLAVVALWVGAVLDVLANAVRAHVDVFRQDLRYTLRTLGRAPGFTVTTILVAALGVGATTATFSITDHVLIRPLPFAEPERLVKLWEDDTLQGYGRTELSPANYRDWKRMSTSFATMAAYHGLSVNLVGEGDPERLEGASVTADLLRLLGAGPALGRAFIAADDQEGAPGTLLLSHGLWQRRFGGDPGVLGRKVILDDEPYTIIGVMPRDFHFPSRTAELWTTTRFAAQNFEDRTDRYLSGVARLQHGVSLEQARADMRLVTAQLEREHPKENAGMRATVSRLRDEVSPQARLLLAALFGAALGVLLIACTNLASLLLARALFRRRELAVRTALGAGRERLVRQLLTESLILAACGGALGVALAAAATPLVARLVPTALPIAETPAIDLRVLLFAAVTTCLTGIGFGVIPALRACGDPDASGLREGSRGGVGGRRERLRSALVVAEVTVSVVLLVSSGLLIRALWRLQGVDPGFRADGVLTLRTALPWPKYEKTQRRGQFYAQVLAGVRSLPGVSNAAYISFLPMATRGGIWPVEVPGQPKAPSEASTVSLRFVTPEFFAALGIPIRQGRDVSESDTRESPFVAVVSESFVRRYWPVEDPRGRRFQVASRDRTIVGVVGDVRVRGLESTSEPQVYLPYQQVADGNLVGYTPKDLVVRSSVDPGMLLPAIRRVIAKADPQQPISDVRTLSDIVEAETAPRSVQVRVLGAFAAIAVLLAGIGIHGLLAFAVSNRAQEIGVRLALGARPRDILMLVLRQGLLMAAAGVVAGVALAYAAGRTLEALLAGVSPRDATTFLVAVAFALVMTLAGSLVPALRAVRVDPLSAIRAE